MASKTKTGTCALILTFTALIFIVIAFTTPCWLVNDGQVENPDFIRIGLWEVCLVNFQDFRHQYDYNFTGCWWVFEEEYYIIHDFLLPNFFIATQFFFTLSLTLMLVAAFLAWMYCFCSRNHDKYLLLLTSTGTDLLLAGLFGFIAILIFGCKGDSRDWMPYWDHNDLSWSYACAVIGTLLLFPAGSLFLVEARRAHYRRLVESRPTSTFSMDVRKSAHTDI